MNKNTNTDLREVIVASYSATTFKALLILLENGYKIKVLNDNKEELTQDFMKKYINDNP